MPTANDNEPLNPNECASCGLWSLGGDNCCFVCYDAHFEGHELPRFMGSFEKGNRHDR